jgi:phasin family protein
MSSITEQLSATSKSQFESQLNFLNNVLKKTVDGAEQVVALNISTAKNAAERSAAATRQLIEAKDARAVLELARPLSAIEGLFAYGRELFTIASKTQVELLQSARERFSDLPARTLVLAAPAVTQVPAQATQSAVHAATDTAQAVAQAASDNVQAATRAAADGAQAIAGTAEQATHAATHAATVTAGSAVEAASNTLAQAAHAAQPATDAVTEAVEQVAQAVADNTPAASTAALFDGEAAPAPKTVRSKPAAKPVAEAVAALADKPATTLKSVPGQKSRK